jgi:hypothetical protein
VVAAAPEGGLSTVASQIEPFPRGLSADMLTQPPLPLVIATGDPDDSEITIEDEEAIIPEGKYAQTRE